MTTVLRFILFFLLAPVFAIVVQATGSLQDDLRIVDAGFRAEFVILECVDGGICSYDSSGALLQQRRSIDGQATDDDGLNGFGVSAAVGAAQSLISDFAELVAARNTPSLDALSQAAGVADRGGLTAAGRSLTKHGAGARPGNTLFPPAKGNPATFNQTAQNVVDDILTTPGSTIQNSTRGRFGPTIEVTAPDGRGIVYDANGKFLFFKE